MSDSILLGLIQKDLKHAENQLKRCPDNKGCKWCYDYIKSLLNDYEDRLKDGSNSSNGNAS